MIVTANGNSPNLVQFCANRAGAGALTLPILFSAARPGVYDWIVHAVDLRFVYSGATAGGTLGVSFQIGASVVFNRNIDNTASSTTMAPTTFFSTGGAMMALRLKGSASAEPSLTITWPNAVTTSYILSAFVVAEPVLDSNCLTTALIV